VSHSCTIPISVNPQLAAAALELGLTLEDLGYSRRYIDLIIRHAAAAGTLVGSPVDPEDEAVAEAAFCEALDAMGPVPYDSECWDRDQAMTFDARMLADGVHPWPIPVDSDDDRAGPDDFDRAMAALEDLPLPISGGAPSPEDLADYHAWSEDLDRRRDEKPARSDRYGVDSLAAIHKALWGRSEPFSA
jgi:hypothetical protein